MVILRYIYVMTIGGDNKIQVECYYGTWGNVVEGILSYCVHNRSYKGMLY